MSTTSITFSELEAAAKTGTSANAQTQAAATETQANANSNTNGNVAQAQTQFTDQDIQTLRTFSDAGITLTNYQQLLQANQLIQKLPDIIKTNPRVLTAEIAKADPAAYRTLLEAVSDEWWEVIGKNDPQYKTAQGTASSNAPSTDPRMETELSAIKGQLANVIAELNQEKSAKQQARIMSGYTDAVTGLLAKLPAEVPESSKDYIRLKTQELIYKDEGARDRVAKGIYVDLPKYFAEASAKATADTKASAAREHDARAGVEARGSKEITPAAEAVNGTTAGPQEDPVWGDTGMMKDLQKALAAK